MINLRRRPGFDDAAGVHHVHAIGVTRHHTEIVRDDDQRDAAVAGQRLHQFQDLRLNRNVQRGRRLIRDDQLRIARQSDRDHHALPHAAGQLMRILFQTPRRVGDAHLRQQRLGAFHRLGARQTRDAAPAFR